MLRTRCFGGVRAFCAAACLATALAAGCGDDTTGSGGEGGKPDGKFHPAKSGVAIDETPACDALHDAVSAQQKALGNCTMTVALCPNLIRAMSGTQCAKYDQGTIDGCAAYYKAATDCADLSTRSQACAVEIIAGSAPNGCPTQ